MAIFSRKLNKSPEKLLAYKDIFCGLYLLVEVVNIDEGSNQVDRSYTPMKAAKSLKGKN
jgi:hypothetical protein